MLIKSEIDVAKSPDQVWAFFNDIPLVASCLPGADISEKVGEDSYTGTVVIKTGPVKLEFTGEATITDRDDAGRRIVVDASGADIKGRGQATLQVVAVMIPSGSGTKVQIDQVLHLSGAVAQYGRGLVQDVTEVLLDHFDENMQQKLEALESGIAIDPNASSSASGTRIAFKALRMSLLRVFGRFFLPYKPTSG